MMTRRLLLVCLIFLGLAAMLLAGPGQVAACQHHCAGVACASPQDRTPAFEASSWQPLRIFSDPIRTRPTAPSSPGPQCRCRTHHTGQAGNVVQAQPWTYSATLKASSGEAAIQRGRYPVKPPLRPDLRLIDKYLADARLLI